MSNGRNSAARQDRVRWNRELGFPYYANPRQLDVFRLPAHVKIVIPRDGGFWLVDCRTGVRYRRVTMADLPHRVSWNTRGKVRSDDGDRDGAD